MAEKLVTNLAIKCLLTHADLADLSRFNLKLSDKIICANLFNLWQKLIHANSRHSWQQKKAVLNNQNGLHLY
ncbi:hypothetical protein AB674_16045 [Flavobacterium sp. ABG]|nr:hypothetical protein AB674_16045 [Flavobacterium sp. ABG]